MSKDLNQTLSVKGFNFVLYTELAGMEPLEIVLRNQGIQKGS